MASSSRSRSFDGALGSTWIGILALVVVVKVVVVKHQVGYICSHWRRCERRRMKVLASKSDTASSSADPLLTIPTLLEGYISQLLIQLTHQLYASAT